MNVEVIPHSLEALLAANDKLFSRDRAEKCDNCGKSSVQLSRCARCQVLYYCGKVNLMLFQSMVISHGY